MLIFFPEIQTDGSQNNNIVDRITRLFCAIGKKAIAKKGNAILFGIEFKSDLAYIPFIFSSTPSDDTFVLRSCFLGGSEYSKVRERVETFF